METPKGKEVIEYPCTTNLAIDSDPPSPLSSPDVDIPEKPDTP